MINRLSIDHYDSPVIAAAIHDGHGMDDGFRALSNLGEHERMREEDPYTAYLARLPANQVVVGVSRFQTDLNRAREKALYLGPEDAWGLQLWKHTPSPEMQKQALLFYDDFYRQMEGLLKRVIHRFGGFVVLDIHSYNHRRQHPDHSAPLADNPEINVGTASNQAKWQGCCQRFIEQLAGTSIRGKHPDVRENIKFKGGWFSQWINQHYGHAGCVFSIECKKTFMDEWTGRVDIDHLHELKRAIADTLPMLSQCFEPSNLATDDTQENH